MTSLKTKFITRIIGYREKLSPSKRKLTDYAVPAFGLKSFRFSSNVGQETPNTNIFHAVILI